jgi:hypothetical protein
MIPPIAPELDPARVRCQCGHPLVAVKVDGVLRCSLCQAALPWTSLGSGAFRLGAQDAPKLGER